MKRKGNLYHQIVSIENLQLADEIARKGKSKRRDIIAHDRNKDNNIQQLRQMLLDKTYTTSPYRTFTITEPKERIVYELPYFPDRITHHAVMNVLEPVLVASYTADTYSCIKGRGLHATVRNMRRALKDRANTTYCLKLDVQKFYPSVDHDILKARLRRKIKDKDLLWLLDNIIDSAEGLPIGNYLSQYFANVYLSGFDHWIKEHKRVKYYFRYADDIVVLAANKPYLHALLADIRGYLADNLKLQIKSNYQVFPVAARSIDFLGYRFYHTHTLLRKSIKQSLCRAVAGKRPQQSIASLLGWASHCNSRHLVKKLLNT